VAARVVAFDYDGTLTQTGLLSQKVRAALREAREDGLVLVIVTGRQRPDLLRVCPDAGTLFDRMVLENGAVLADRSGPSRLLAPQVDRRLGLALEAMDIPIDYGEVLLATEARWLHEAEQEAIRLGLDVRMFLNRASLMMLPPSVSKASGLSHALASLGVDMGSVIAVGDAENDREMLEAAALGVAVGDAVGALKAVADRVLEKPDGEGVVELLRELVAGS
jgi:hydroxymethylpyrimidine pyrophosphatase-like HAD family hydrolase